MEAEPRLGLGCSVFLQVVLDLSRSPHLCRGVADAVLAVTARCLQLDVPSHTGWPSSSVLLAAPAAAALPPGVLRPLKFQDAI